MTTYTKTYGIKEGYVKGKIRFFVVCDERETSLHYARKEFAMKKSFEFCKACYRDFVRDNGEQVKFEFKQV